MTKNELEETFEEIDRLEEKIKVGKIIVGLLNTLAVLGIGLAVYLICKLG